MANVVDFEEREVSKIRRLAEDWQLERLKRYPCPVCDAKLNLIDNWKCGCCGSKNGQPEPGFWPKLTGSYRKKPMHTVLDGCLDRYCDFPKQAAVQCHSCEAYLVFDRSALMVKKGEKSPVVAQLYDPSALENQGLLGLALTIADEVLPNGVEAAFEEGWEEFKKDVASGREVRKTQMEADRQTAMREARRGLDPEPEPKEPDPDDEADDIAKMFGGRGFGR